VARRKEKLDEVASQAMSRHGAVEILPIVADISNVDPKSIISQVVAKFGSRFWVMFRAI